MGSSRAIAVALAVTCGLGCSRSSNTNGVGNSRSNSNSGSASRFTVAGSSALVPLVSAAANRYMRAHPDVTIQVSAGGSRQGLAQAASGAVAVGDSDVFATGEQASSLVDHRVAVVGFATMANRGAFDDAVTSLTQEQLRGIFSGRIHNWSEVGGGDQLITVINRARSSGTRAVFGAVVLGGDNFVEGVAEQDNSGQLQTMLGQQTGAVSYLALSYRNDRLKVFAYNGVEPTAENIASGRYPVWSYEHMYTRGQATGAVSAFIDFVLSSEIQNDVLPRLGFVPISTMRVSRDHD